MVSNEKMVFIIFTVLGLSVLIVLAAFTDTSRLVRFVTALCVGTVPPQIYRFYNK